MTLWRLLEAQMGKQGKQEFVQFLRLMESIPSQRRRHRSAGRYRARCDRLRRRQALILRHIEPRPQCLDMTIYPYLADTS